MPILGKIRESGNGYQRKPYSHLRTSALLSEFPNAQLSVGGSVLVVVASSRQMDCEMAARSHHYIFKLTHFPAFQKQSGPGGRHLDRLWNSLEVELA